MQGKNAHKINGKLLCAAGTVLGRPVLMLAPGRATRRQKAPFRGMNFAHRGLHSRDNSVPENSLKAFELAAAAGYGIELDKRRIVLDEQIKTVGEYTVKCKLGYEITADLKVEVREL